MKTVICLYGPSGAGKSTAGKLLADALNLRFYDLDCEIERESASSVAELFRQKGETHFRCLEKQCLMALLQQGESVIALGGGALLDSQNRAAVEKIGMVVVLSAPLEILVGRLRKDENQRPLIAEDIEARLKALLAQRQEHYQSFPVQVNCADDSPDKVAWKIQVALGRFYIRGMGKGYPIRVERGGMDCLGEMLRAGNFKGPVALVSDENVGLLYGEKARQSLQQAGYETIYKYLPAGETYKHIHSVSELWETFLDGGLERGSTVVALGGGVVGDLTGFAAATYLRGVQWVNVPTSLLAMVDSSMGGKTGANLPRGKNLIGSFHAPGLVLSDADFLFTLPPDEIRCGLGEVVKSALIGDSALFSLCAQGWKVLQEVWEEVVRRSAAVKARVIVADPFEQGVRESLNLGHTIGHGIEKASDFRCKHGEAVAIGLVIEARMAETLGIAEAGLSEEISVVLAGLGLPYLLPPDMDKNRVLQAMRLDKKRKDGKVRFALPMRVGKVQTGVIISDWEKLISWNEK